MPTVLEAAAQLTPAQARDFLRFRNFAPAWWRIPTKSSGWQPFRLKPAQILLENEYERQMDERGYVRLNVLKCRQVGCTTWATRRALLSCMLEPARTALTVAHRQQEPTKWLSWCRENVKQTPGPLCPATRAMAGNLISFQSGSSYGIGSAEGGFPGVGDTVQTLHLSELGRWDKPPISKNPDDVLIPLMPAVPSGEDIGGSVVLREATGVMVGDWWNRRWREEGSEYAKIFLPWFLVPEYRADASEILSLSDYEQQLARIAQTHGVALDHAQYAWRRWQLRADFAGKDDEFRAEYPATEDEAFMSPGLTIYNADMVALARQTEREPVSRGNLLAGRDSEHPEQARFEPNPSGEMVVWEEPDSNLHYALAADCMWGKRKECDFDVLYVECLETGRTCAKVKFQTDMQHWGWIIAAVGFKYNVCPVAPERNSQAGSSGEGVLAALLGHTANWRYPNVWIRNKTATIRPRLEDYGWLTRHSSKALLIAGSIAGTLDSSLDWCDKDAIDQMGTIIRHEDNSIGAPAGMNDDAWIARLITAEVAKRERNTTDLYVKPEPIVYTFNDMPSRFAAMAADDEEET